MVACAVQKPSELPSVETVQGYLSAPKQSRQGEHARTDHRIEQDDSWHSLDQHERSTERIRAALHDQSAWRRISEGGDGALDDRLEGSALGIVVGSKESQISGSENGASAPASWNP